MVLLRSRLPDFAPPTFEAETPRTDLMMGRAPLNRAVAVCGGRGRCKWWRLPVLDGNHLVEVSSVRGNLLSGGGGADQYWRQRRCTQPG